MKLCKSRIISNHHIKNSYYELSISSDYIPRFAKPGQFVHIKCSDNNTPLLRRPFSIHSVSKEKNTFKILYEVLGKGTGFLSKKKAGDFLDIIGPLGNGFDFQTTDDRRQTTVLVAGGMGTAPLLFLAEKLVHNSQFTVHRKPLVLIGAKTKNLILCKDEFKKLGCDVKIATEDGSLGFKGKVTDLLKEVLSTVNCQLSTVYACGPYPMLKEVSKIAKKHRINCQVSLEEIIACGVGACLGCAVSTKGGFKLVCKDGPVFNSDEIIWR
ncbi:MAG: dihydroorotate dehydrogenase electron transfer subunit [Candidatus Omnitrophica bacterium]|nr:dihydroorotate dehydrogenase electron transfer subunit [Candidatus Omnitrophota bacterium]